MSTQRTLSVVLTVAMTIVMAVLILYLVSLTDQIGLTHYLALSAILFGIGFFGVLTRRNAIGILMSIELMFNAVNINFVAFNRYITPSGPTEFTGQIFAVFTIVIAAAEATVGLAIVLLIYRNFRDIFVDNINFMKW